MRPCRPRRYQGTPPRNSKHCRRFWKDAHASFKRAVARGNLLASDEFDAYETPPFVASPVDVGKFMRTTRLADGSIMTEQIASADGKRMLAEDRARKMKEKN